MSRKTPWNKALRLLIQLLFLFVSPQGFTEEIERPPLVLGQGEQRILRIPGLSRYSIGSACLRVHGAPSSKNTLLLKGVCPGHADLWISKQDGSSEHRSIRIEKIAPTELAPGLEKALGHLEETEVLIEGPGVILTGQIQSRRELTRIWGLKQAFPKEVNDETEPASELLQQAETQLNQWLKNTHQAHRLTLERQNKQLFVRGSMERPDLRAAAEKEIRALYPAAVIELDSLPDAAPTVHFRVFLLELKKSRFHSLGISWPAMQEAAVRLTTSGIQQALGLDLTLQMLEGEGAARILSNPELVVRAPGEAELFAGGELPIKTKSAYSSNLTWKNYGLTLRLKVAATSGEQVRLEIFTEVSHLDTKISIDEIPGIQTNRMRTQVDARYGTPLLLSGLLQNEMRQEARGLPFLHNIPILGSLFGSDDYLNERSELVAILVPSSAPPKNPLERLTRRTPRGPAPPPREWISPEQERILKASPDWPWNALQ